MDEAKECGEVPDILGNKDKFRHPFLNRVKAIHGPGFFLATDTPGRGERGNKGRCSGHQRRPQNESVSSPFKFYENTEVPIAKQPYKLVGCEGSRLDLVRVVFRVVQT